MDQPVVGFTYYVVLHEGQWKIKYGEKRTDPYPSQKVAIRAAVDAAHQHSKNGTLSEVRVQGEDNLFRTEWTYGKDPYPLPGAPTEPSPGGYRVITGNGRGDRLDLGAGH